MCRLAVFHADRCSLYSQLGCITHYRPPTVLPTIVHSGQSTTSTRPEICHASSYRWALPHARVQERWCAAARHRRGDRQRDIPDSACHDAHWRRSGTGTRSARRPPDRRRQASRSRSGASAAARLRRLPVADQVEQLGRARPRPVIRRADGRRPGTLWVTCG